MVAEIQNNSGNYSLTAKQTRAVGYLLTSRTVAEAAEKAGVTERTVFAWLKLEGFRAALRDASRTSVDQTSRRLADGQAQALDTLATLMTNGINEGVKRAAAVDWLNLTLKYRDLNELEERITRLEEMLDNGE